MQDEPFEQWVRRREKERERRKGRVRLSALTPGVRRGSHVHPEAPRLISRWDGYRWQPVAVVADLAAAKAALSFRSPVSSDDGEVPDDDGRRATAAGRRRARLRRLVDEVNGAATLITDDPAE